MTTELEEMIRSALARFRGNPYWREYYEKAPSEACRKWIELSFVYSTYYGPENINELSESCEKEFTLKDWEYLCRHAGNNPFRGKCRAKIRELGGKVH